MNCAWFAVGQSKDSLFISITTSEKILLNYRNGKLRMIKWPQQAHSELMYHTGQEFSCPFLLSLLPSYDLTFQFRLILLRHDKKVEQKGEINPQQTAIG